MEGCEEKACDEEGCEEEKVCRGEV